MQVVQDQVWEDKRKNTYTIVAVARDIQTEDNIVVYRQNFGSNLVLCCPIDAFLVSMSPVEKTDSGEVKEAPKKTDFIPPRDATQMMLEFLDTQDFSLKLKIIKELQLRGELNDSIIDNMAASLDLSIEEGDIQKRYDQLRFCVETRARYEINRLR